VFNVLMNNRDDHAKNLSFVMQADGSWQLAPPYDLTYCPGYQGEHFMDVAGEGRAPARQHVLQAAQAAGLPRAVAERTIDEMLALLTPATLLDLADGLTLRKATVTQVLQAMQSNFARLAG